ncbi:MAG: DNA-processing protein DprA [Clostridia bacterium]|nr:DNA-processing protein DprA [Clostridia bacterium]
MLEKELFWLWLIAIDGITGYDITALLEVFDSAEDVYKAEKYDNIIGIKPSVKSKLKNKDLKEAKRMLEAAKSVGAKVITFDSINYPDTLRFIANPPYVLYLRGEIPNWDRLLMIGVVGTRNATDYGIAATKKICTELAESGVTIVSGMARGIDSVAARSALSVGGKTIAVLGCGVEKAYPAENQSLMNEIMKSGAVISEYPIGSEPLKIHFPERNRIISGLSRGVLVTEAPKKSGALITANYAVDAGRDLFSVPGSIFNPTSAGTNGILGMNAKAVTCGQDILDEYSYEINRLNIEKPKKNIFKALINKDPHKKINNEMKISLDDKKYQSLSDDERTIAELLIESSMHIDELTRRSGIEISKLTPILSMLEFGGYIKKIPGNNYKLNI